MQAAQQQLAQLLHYINQWEVDGVQACRRGYHLLRIPCEHYHRIMQHSQQQQPQQLKQQQQQQQQQQQHLLRQQMPSQSSAMLDNLTSCTIKTYLGDNSNHVVEKTEPSNSLPQQRQQIQMQRQQLQQQHRRRRLVDQAIYQRMRTILSEAGETETMMDEGRQDEEEEETEEDKDEGEDEEDDDEEEEEDDEDKETAHNGEYGNGEDDEAEEDEEEETGDPDEQDEAAEEADGDAVEESEAGDDGRGFEIVSEDGASSRTNDIPRAGLFPDSRATVSQSESVANRGSRGAMTLQATSDQVTNRSILKNGGGHRSYYTGTTYSSENVNSRPNRTDAPDSSTAVTISTLDSSMSRMRARQAELTRCVLQEQHREEQRRQRLEFDPAVKEAMQKQRRVVLQGIVPPQSPDQHQHQQQTQFQQLSQQQLLQQQQQQLMAMHDRLERWDNEVPAALRGVDSAAVPPPPASEAANNPRRRIQLTGLNGLCRDRRPFVAQSREMQARAGPAVSAAFGGRWPNVTDRLYTTEAPYNVNTEEAKLFRRFFCRALDPSVLPAARAI